MVPERVRGLKFFFLQHVDKNFYKLKPLNFRIQIRVWIKTTYISRRVCLQFCHELQFSSRICGI